MGKCTERLYNGIVKENPTFVQVLGMCPTLAVTSSAINGAGMGLATTCILVLSNAFISLFRKVIPDKVRIPSFIVIIASFVTVIQFLMEAFVPTLNASLGIYIPLIVVNCIILGRAESYASKNKVLPSIFDGLGMGLGFTIGLTLIGTFREFIGKGSVFGFQILGENNILQGVGGIGKYIGDVLAAYTPITIFVLAPGAFFVLAFLIAFLNKKGISKAAKSADGIATCKPSACASCTNTMCRGKIFDGNMEEFEPSVVETKEEPEKPKIVIPDKIAKKPVPEHGAETQKEKKDAGPDMQDGTGEKSGKAADSEESDAGKSTGSEDSANSKKTGIPENAADHENETILHEESGAETKEADALSEDAKPDTTNSNDNDDVDSDSINKEPVEGDNAGTESATGKDDRKAETDAASAIETKENTENTGTDSQKTGNAGEAEENRPDADMQAMVQSRTGTTENSPSEEREPEEKVIEEKTSKERASAENAFMDSISREGVSSESISEEDKYDYLEEQYTGRKQSGKKRRKGKRR